MESSQNTIEKLLKLSERILLAAKYAKIAALKQLRYYFETQNVQNNYTR